ncbi:MAG: glycosyl transferase family 2, partial [Pseudomonadota bacterium]|nr:glycosyl transferase family 2 [Pseudomonadota bacterium]
VDMAGRIGRRRLKLLPVAAVTSAERYRKGGYWLRPARNLLCVGLFLVGFPPRLIGDLYQ